MNTCLCPKCGCKVLNDGRFLGKIVSCPGCQTQFRMPLGMDPAPAPPCPPVSGQSPEGDFSWISDSPQGSAARDRASSFRRPNLQKAKIPAPYVFAGVAIIVVVGGVIAVFATGALQTESQPARPPVAASALGTPKAAQAPSGPTPTTKSSSVWIAEGQRSLDDSDNEAAVRAFSGAIASDPKSAAAFNGRGVAYLRMNRRGSATEDFNKAIEIDPNVAKFYGNRALVYSDKEEYSLALADLNRAIALEPESPRWRAQRSQAYLAMGDKDNAKADADFSQGLAKGGGASDQTGQSGSVEKLASSENHDVVC